MTEILHFRASLQGGVTEAAAVRSADLFDQGRQVVFHLGDAAGVAADGLGADLHRSGVLVPGLEGQMLQQGHAGEHAVAGLLEVHRPGVVVHVHGDLIHPGQRVHHQHVLLGPLQLPAGEHIDALVPLVLQGVHKALLLDAGHVQHVQLGDDRLQAGDLGEPHVVLPHKDPHVVGDRQFPGGDEEKLDVPELGHGLDEGVDGAAVLQIAAQPKAQPVHPAPQAGDGGQVGHGLGGVHVAAVPGVHHRHMGVQGGRLGRALPGGAHDHHVGVVGHHPHRVLHALPLGHRGGVGVGKAEHRPAQPHHSGLEREVGAGGRLVKQVAGHLAVAHVHEALRRVHDLTGPGVQGLPLLTGHISKVDQMSHHGPSFPRYSSKIPGGARREDLLSFHIIVSHGEGSLQH